MQYKEIVQAIFLERPNRFIALCEVNGMIEKVHVKNTGRCKELLIKGVTVYLEVNNDPKRKTKYSLITVQKGKRLINMDSQAPNVVVEEGLKSGSIKLPGLRNSLTLIKREKTYGSSRFDFYLEAEEQKIFMEVKGATLEQEDYVMFPDAKTERGLKHIQELIAAHKEGYMCYVLFVIQMADIMYFTPHRERHPEFAHALQEASEEGVHILAFESKVTPCSLELTKEVSVYL